MNALRRLAPLSLSLALLLTNGSAMAYNGYRVAYDAKPAAQKHDGVFKSFGHAIKAGITDFKEQRAAAGPGFLKRGLIKTGNAFRSIGSSIKGAFRSAKKGTIELKSDVKSAMHASWTADKAVFTSAGRAVNNGLKDVAKETKKAVQSDVRSITKLEKVVSKAIAAKKVAIAEHRAKEAEYKAADKDFKSWLNQNPSMKTFYKGARADEKLGLQKTGRISTLVSGGVATAVGVATVDPVAVAIGGANFAVSHAYKKDMVSSERKARERTVDMGMKTISAARLERWSKAGIIDPELAK